MPHAGAEGINKAISPEMMGIAQNIIAATVLGYVSMTIADLLKGNSPAIQAIREHGWPQWQRVVVLVSMATFCSER